VQAGCCKRCKKGDSVGLACVGLNPQKAKLDQNWTGCGRYLTLPDFVRKTHSHSDKTQKTLEFLAKLPEESFVLKIRCPQGRVGSSPTSGIAYSAGKNGVRDRAVPRRHPPKGSTVRRTVRRSVFFAPSPACVPEVNCLAPSVADGRWNPSGGPWGRKRSRKEGSVECSARTEALSVTVPGR